MISVSSSVYTKVLPSYIPANKKVKLITARRIKPLMVKGASHIYKLSDVGIFYDINYITIINLYRDRPVNSTVILWDDVLHVYIKRIGIIYKVCIRTATQRGEFSVNYLLNSSLLNDFVTQAEVYFKLKLM